jgi:hypothetical protein
MAKSNKSSIIKKAFPELLRKKMTNVTLACQEANIDRSTYYAWRNEDPEFAAACDEAIEMVFDSVESVMYKKVLVDHDTTCLIYFTKTKMKNRGYVERVESTGKDGSPLTQVNYTVEVAKARIKDLLEKK